MLSNKPLFYYVCGICLLSHLIYMMSNLLSKTPVMYRFVTGDWTIRIYFLQYLWQNLGPMIEEYQSHVLSCVVFIGTANFVTHNFTDLACDGGTQMTNDYLLQTVQFVGSYTEWPWNTIITRFYVICVLSYSVSGNTYCTVIFTTCQLSHLSRSLIWMQNVTRVKFSHVNIIPLLYTILISILHYIINDNAGLIYTAATWTPQSPCRIKV